MGAIVYLTKDELLQYYDDTIVQSGGGMSGIRYALCSTAMGGESS